MLLWHNALKLNKGIYKTTEHLSDGEILKKQLREQSNEIISTLSVYYSRSPVPAEKRTPSASPSASVPPTHYSLPTTSASVPPTHYSLPTTHFSDSEHSYRDFYIPEKSICLMLLLDKITVLKTFLFLAKEHNFLTEEKHQILTAACVHLSESIQTEISGADIFSHPVFASASALPTHHSLPTEEPSADNLETGFPSESEPSTHSTPPVPSAPISYKLNAKRFPEETLLDILNMDLNQMSDKNTDEIVSDIARENQENKENQSDIANKKANSSADEYIAKSKARQNKKSYKSYLTNFSKLLSRQQNSQNPNLSASAENSAFPSSDLPNINVFSGGRNSKYSLPADSVPSAVICEEEPDFSIFPSFLSNSAFSEVEPLSLEGSISKNSPSAPVPPTHYSLPTTHFPLTIRQQKIYDYIAEKGRVQVGEMLPIFPEKLSEKTIRRDLQILMEKSLITQSGSRRWTYYSVV